MLGPACVGGFLFARNISFSNNHNTHQGDVVTVVWRFFIIFFCFHLRYWFDVRCVRFHAREMRREKLLICWFINQWPFTSLHFTYGNEIVISKYPYLCATLKCVVNRKKNIHLWNECVPLLNVVVVLAHSRRMRTQNHYSFQLISHKQPGPSIIVYVYTVCRWHALVWLCVRVAVRVPRYFWSSCFCFSLFIVVPAVSRTRMQSQPWPISIVEMTVDYIHR